MPHVANKIAGEDRRPGVNTTWHFRRILDFYTQAFALGFKTGNWHVFPIDNPSTSARIGIAGARALSFPPRPMRGNRNEKCQERA